MPTGRDSPEVRVGLLGLGQMGRNHLRVLSMLKGITVGFVSDTDEGLGQGLAAKYGAPFRTDLDKALAEVDAVVICTPTSTHDHYVRQSAPHVKNIFVEKPLTDSLESSERLHDFAEANGLSIQVGFIERFNPAVQQLKAVLRDSPNIVSIDFMRTNKVSSRITDVDVIVDLMIHDVDLALYLNGPVSSVSSHGLCEKSMIVFSSALLTHSNGRFSRIQASRITEKKMRHIQATCQDMFIDCELLRKEIVITRRSVQAQMEGSPYTITATEETVAVRPEEALLSELQAFIANCNRPGTVAVPQVADAIDAMSICEEIQRLIKSGVDSGAALPELVR